MYNKGKLKQTNVKWEYACFVEGPVRTLGRIVQRDGTSRQGGYVLLLGDLGWT